MSTLITESIQDAEQLYRLVDDIRDEAMCWRDKHIRRALHRAAAQLEAAARAALHQPPIFAEAWQEAATRYLAAHVLHRRFLETLSPLGVRTRRPVVTLDCRDGVHGACAVCDCPCHRGEA